MCKPVKLNNIKPNPNNPRLIKDDKFKKLVKSIQDFRNDGKTAYSLRNRYRW